MENPHDLAQLVRSSTARISADYKRMQSLAREDPGTSGDQGEEDWAKILREWLPASFHVVTKGRIINSSGQTSPQVDVIVLSPSYPNGLLYNKLYIAAGVLAAFECKRSKAVGTSVAISRLIRADQRIQQHIIYGLLAHSHLIASKRKPAELTLRDALIAEDLKQVSDPRDCLDFVCVADLGTWSHSRFIVRSDESGKGVVGTAYMGPYLGFSDDALGRFLTILLHRLRPPEVGPDHC